MDVEIFYSDFVNEREIIYLSYLLYISTLTESIFIIIIYLLIVSGCGEGRVNN